MSHTTPLSPLAALPPELFCHILGYVFDPAQSEVPESTTNFRGYVFDTSLLRVNKAVHRLAKSHLHFTLSWVRFDINWAAFLIDPHWLSVPYITRDRVEAPKVLPYPYAGDTTRRSPHQQAPLGRVVVRITFPSPTTPVQNMIQAECFNGPFASSMSVLVLERDFARFITVLRMNDLAYCNRILPTASTSDKFLATRRDEGISIDIENQAGLEDGMYNHLLSKITKLSGPFHQLTINGHEDPASAATFVSEVEMRQPGLDRGLQILGAKEATYLEAMSHLLSLKYQGDDYLRRGLHANAFVCYEYALKFEQDWRVHDLQPADHTMWHAENNVCKAWGIAIACNIAMAYVAGGLKVRTPVVHGRHMSHNTADLLIMRGGWNGTSIDRFLELVYTMIFCYIFQVHDEQPFSKVFVVCLYGSLRTLSAWWEELSPGTKRSDSSSLVPKLYNRMQVILNIPEVVRMQQAWYSGDIHATLNDEEALKDEIEQHLDALRLIMRDVEFTPMVWGIRKELLPASLSQSLPVWRITRRSNPEPPIHAGAESGNGSAAHSQVEPVVMTEELHELPHVCRVGEELCIPIFDEISQETLRSGGTERRIYI